MFWIFLAVLPNPGLYSAVFGIFELMWHPKPSAGRPAVKRPSPALPELTPPLRSITYFAFFYRPFFRWVNKNKQKKSADVRWVQRVRNSAGVDWQPWLEDLCLGCVHKCGMLHSWQRHTLAHAHHAFWYRFPLHPSV